MFIPWLDSLYLHQVPQEGCGTHLLEKLICRLVGRLVGFCFQICLFPPPAPQAWSGPFRRPSAEMRRAGFPRARSRVEGAGRAPSTLPLVPTRAGSPAAPGRWSFRPGPGVAGPSARARFCRRSGPRPERAVGRSIRRAVPRRVHTLSPAARCVRGRAPGAGRARGRRSEAGPSPAVTAAPKVEMRKFPAPTDR